MTITAVEKLKGRRYRIEVDGAYWYILDVELVANHQLKPGMACDQEFLDALRTEADTRKLRERALYLLEYRDHSRKELIEKLLRSVDNRTLAEQTADQMEAYGFLDDRRYAEKLARSLLLHKKLGKRRALYTMLQKGVCKDLALEALERVDVDPGEQLDLLLRRTYGRYLGDEKGKRKVVNALARKGFAYDEIKLAIERYTLEEDDAWQ